MHPPDPLPARGAGEWAPRRRLVKKPGVPAGGDCELLQVLLRANERAFRPAGGRDGLCGCFAIFIAPQMTAGYLLQPPPAGTCDRMMRRAAVGGLSGARFLNKTGDARALAVVHQFTPARTASVTSNQ